MREDCFHASKNNGAFLNQKGILVSTTKELKESLVATGFPYYDFEKIDQYLDLLKDLMNSTRGIRRPGAAAIDLVYVACGRFDAFFEYSLSPWDVAAGALIVKEAGGVVSDFNQGSNWLYGKEISASNKNIAKEFNSRINLFF